jgi:ribosomal protein S18 acetylase RimI-like enzyme
MKTNTSVPNIREITSSDLPFLKTVIDATELFPSEMLDGMMSGYFDGSTPDLWLTIDEGEPVAIAYCAPERMTQGTWNLLLLAVTPARQGAGHGTALLRHVESFLATQSERLLLVETSGLPEFNRTRAFYEKNGYTEVAKICDYYENGDDKIIFRKQIA